MGWAGSGGGGVILLLLLFMYFDPNRGLYLVCVFVCVLMASIGGHHLHLSHCDQMQSSEDGCENHLQLILKSEPMFLFRKAVIYTFLLLLLLCSRRA